LLYILPYLMLLVLIVWILVQRLEYRRERTKSLRATAEKLGFAFTENDADFLRIIKKSNYLCRAVSASNCFSKKNEDVEIKIADSHYSKDGSIRVATTCLIIDYRMNLPSFYLRREDSLSDGIGRLFEMQDINFDDDLPFSKAFVLQSKDEVLAKYLFNSEVRNFVMRYAGSAAQIEGAGPTLFIHKGRLEWAPDFEALAREALELCQLLKKTVEKEGLDN